MSEVYGVQPTGYVRKPLSVILGELEAAMVTEFGPGVVQTPQSPFGQLNGLMSDLLAEVDERNLDLYQSYDPDQAEGIRLDTLARIRLIFRNGRTDQDFRMALTNEGRARIDILDVEAALGSISGVTYSKMFPEALEFEAGNVAVAVIGGDDDSIAAVLRQYVVPGMGTWGNTRISSEVNGYCRSFSIIRPVPVPVSLVITLRAPTAVGSCPSPSPVAIESAILDGWLSMRENGTDITHYVLRSLIERQFPQMELISFTGQREDILYEPNFNIPINFLEIGELTAESVEVRVQ